MINKADDGEDVCNTCSTKKASGEEEFEIKKEIIKLGVGTSVYILALLLKLSFLGEISLFLLSYIIVGHDILWKAAKNIFYRKVFDENFLLTVATTGAFAIGEFPEAMAVMLFFKVGEMVQNMALNRSRKSIKSLIEIRPDYANLKQDGELKKVEPDKVSVGELVVIKPGERVPLDGIVVEGESMVDTSTLTGESVPRKVEKGEQVLSGMVNKTGLITVRVTKKFGESTVAKILDLVENAASKKAPTEKFITRFARYYTPAVVLGAVLLAVVPVMLYHIPVLNPLFSHQETFSEWIYKALIFLVISCPCALVISIPLGFFGGIGASSRRGVLVKGSNYLEELSNIQTLVWDKTGTLTKGVFKVTSIVPKNNFSKEEIIRFAAMVESNSNHPIAYSIMEAFGRRINEGEIESYEEISGYGIKAKVKGHFILAGNDKLLHRENIEHDTCNVEGTTVHVAVDGKYVGYIIISDEIKHDAKATIQKLRDLGIEKQIMFTGDDKKVAESICQKLGLDEYFAELLPQQKVKKIEELMKNRKDKKGRIAFVGDGINDAPVLMYSDIGIAMGALGSDAAIEAADVVLMTDELSRLPEAVKISKKTKSIVWQNISFALGVKGIFLVIGVLGMATMWEAVFADVGVALIAIANAVRIIAYPAP